MCGIVGIFDTKGHREIDKDLLHRMNETQFHRGPDGGGLHCEPGVGFGHRRLSIIDLSGGHQPLFNEDESVVVTYNGEIYNFPELAKELKEAGHVFKTHCDTEVIVHAWEEWGEECVQRFRGMFAFALWDRNCETLFLVRDRLGVKPLFYAYLPDGYLIFSSELKALYEHPSLPKKIDPCAVEDYFGYGYIPEPKTIYKNVFKLEPGHTLTHAQGKDGKIQQYWDVPFAPVAPMTDAGYQETLMEKVREAVDIRMISEVPLGAFLSGGVDSSAVVAMMAELSDEPVKTCSISFGDKKFNEAEHANKIAEKFKTEHYVDEVHPDDFSLLDDLAGFYDEPYADSSAIPTYRVCELARKSVTVALSGDGADEHLAGYRRYKWHMNEESVRSCIPLGVRKPVFGFLGRAYPKADWAPRVFRAKSTFEGLARDSVEAYFHTISIFPDRLREQLFSEDFKRSLEGYSAVDVLRRHAKASPTDHPLSLVQYLDLKTYLVGDILTKVDRASMANSLEVREPLLDHKLVEWTTGIPPEQKYHKGEGKYVFKKALESRLPGDILYRPKMGFAVPLATWFRGPLKERVRDALLGDTLAQTGIFNVKFLKHIVEKHQSGVNDYSAPIWSLLMFDAFLRRHVV